MNSFGEQHFFFGAPGQRMFAVLHAPVSGAPRRLSAWLLCDAFGEERNQSHRHMVEWARRLAREGFWVMRFDYRGYGDSDGVFEEQSLQDHLDDIVAAAAELEQRSGVPCAGLGGLRLGATLAAMASARLPQPTALILWEPMLKGEDYLDELLLFVMSRQMKESGKAPKTREQLHAEVDSGKGLDVLGHVLSRDQFREIAAINLIAHPPQASGPVCLVRISNRGSGKIPSSFLAFHEALAHGCDTALQTARTYPFWYAATKEYDVRPECLFEPTVEWVRACPPPPSQPAGKALRPFDAADTVNGPERVVCFDVNGQHACGVLHTPENVSRSRPLVLMLSVAENCRTTDARIYVKMARVLGRHGWASLRIDPRGVGDSQGALEGETVPELYYAIQNGALLADTRAALDFAERELGVRAFVLTGICGGAITAILQAAQDDRVVAVAPLELTLLYDTLPGVATTTRRSRRFLRRVLIEWQPDGARQYSERLWRLMKRMYGRTKSAIQGTRHLHRFVDIVGPRANTVVLDALLVNARRQLPMLAVFAETFGAGAFADIMPHLKKRYGHEADRLIYHKVEQADHLFTAPAHMDETIRTLVDWLDSRAL